MADAGIRAGGDRSRWFYAGMAQLCLGVALVGFLPTFFVPLAQGAFHRPPVFYIHGLLYFSWVLYFAAQAWLAASGRLTNHREWGVLGAALASAMAFSVMAVVVTRLNQRPPIPAGPGSASFAWLDVSELAFFASCIALGFSNTPRPQVHKRLMLLATMSLLNAPVARWTQVIFHRDAHLGSTFLLENWFNFLVVGLMAVAAAFDLRTEGRVSKVYLLGIPAYLLVTTTAGAIGASATWLQAADWIKHWPG